MPRAPGAGIGHFPVTEAAVPPQPGSRRGRRCVHSLLPSQITGEDRGRPVAADGAAQHGDSCCSASGSAFDPIAAEQEQPSALDHVWEARVAARRAGTASPATASGREPRSSQA